MFAIGIDIGGTNTRVGVVKSSGELHAFKEIPTNLSLAPAQFLKIITEECHSFLQDASAIGIGIAGQTENGFLHFAPNLQWKNIAIGKLFHELTGLPVLVENDVRAALYGESICGAGKDCDNLLLISLGTGLGGAVISNGQLLRGDRGSAAEIGHLCIDFNGHPCTCGSNGCLEAYVGGWAIQKNSAGLSPAQVFQRAKIGDPHCLKIIKEVNLALGAGVASLLNIFNPRRVIYSGGIFQAHPELVESMKVEAKKRALAIPTGHLEWRQGELEHPGVIGSALAALDPNFHCVR